MKKLILSVFLFAAICLSCKEEVSVLFPVLKEKDWNRINGFWRIVKKDLILRHKT